MGTFNLVVVVECSCLRPIISVSSPSNQSAASTLERLSTAKGSPKKLSFISCWSELYLTTCDNFDLFISIWTKGEKAGNSLANKSNRDFYFLKKIELRHETSLKCVKVSVTVIQFKYAFAPKSASRLP